MSGRFIRLLVIIACLSIIQGCSGGSGGSNPTGTGDGDGGGWSTQLVRSGSFANGEISAAIDANGKLYVSAYDLNVGLQYITNKSGTWAATLVAEDDDNSAGTHNDIAVDDGGKVHIMYSHYDGISYITDETGTWSGQDMWLGGGGSCCIVLDGANCLHAAFDDGDNSDVRYTRKSAGGAWETAVALADEWINSACDIDVDGSNNPRVAFNFAGHHNLRCAFFNGSWNVVTLEGTDSYPYIPDTGWTPSIAVDRETDTSNIVFWNSTDNKVQFSNGTANTAVTLKDTVGWARPCVALDSAGHAHVFFGEEGSNALNYATNKSGSWVNTVLSIEIGEEELAVVIDSDDKIHVFYSSKTYLDLYHAGLQL